MKYDVNSRIINRLELTLKKYLVNRITHTELESYIESSITALEGLDTSIVDVAREFSYKFDMARFADEDDDLQDVETVTRDFRSWLRILKEKSTEKT